MKRHILFVIDSLVGGGAEKIMSYLVNGLNKEKYRVSIYISLDTKIEYEISNMVNIYSSSNQELKTVYDNEFDIKLKIEKIAKFYNIKYFTSNNMYSKKREDMEKFLRDIYLSSTVLNGIIQKEKPDLIVSFLINSNLITLIARNLFQFDIPICCSDHNTLSTEIKSLPYPFLYSSVIRLLYKKSDYHVAVSEGSKNDLIKFCGLPNKNIYTIYNGIDLDKVKKQSAEQLDDDLTEILADKSTRKIVTSGRLTDQKNQSLLIRAYKKIQNRSNTKLLILGTGEKQENLQQLAEKLGLDDDVLFLGWRKNPFNIISKCDVFVLSSDWEGLPLVLIEAMSLGVPVISTDCPSGPSEILEGRKYGVLVQPNNENKLAEAITKLLSDNQLRSELSRSGKERARNFSLEKMVDSYEKFFATVIQ